MSKRRPTGRAKVSRKAKLKDRDKLRQGERAKAIQRELELAMEVPEVRAALLRLQADREAALETLARHLKQTLPLYREFRKAAIRPANPQQPAAP
jgi:hypothetical protein